MSAVRIRVLSARPVDQVQGLARGLATFLVASSLLIVLFCGTFPFDFSSPAGSAWDQLSRQFDWNWNPYDPGYIDRSENIVFFMPFGFALAGVIRPRRFRAVLSIAASIPAGAILSTAIEAAQAFVSFRDPSFADIWCNTLGSLLGAIVFVICGDRFLHWTATGLLHLKRLATPATLGCATAAYALVHLWAPLLVHSPGDLSVWDNGMPLLVGNELTGNRPWNGSVSEIILADRAATADQALKLAGGADPGQLLGQSLLAHYQLRGKGPYPDLSGHLKALAWAKDAPVDLADDESPPIHPDQWLKTPAAIAQATYRIQTSGQFTLAARVQTFNSDQHGPARIAGISNSPWSHDVQIGQDDGADLAIRVRTAVRVMPSLYLRGIFGDTQWHHIIVTQNQGQIVVYLEGMEIGRCEVTPEAKVIWMLYPRNGFRLRIERYGFRSYAAIYRLMVFIPFCALLGATVASSNWKTRTRRMAALGALVVMALALETVLGLQSAGGFSVKNLIISLLIGSVTLMALAWRRRRTLAAIKSSLG